jgi:hypothetical protein
VTDRDIALVAAAAAVLALIATAYAAWHAKRSADAAVNAERHERRPRLELEPHPDTAASMAAFIITNRGPVDLDALVITTPLARAGGEQIVGCISTPTGGVQSLDLGRLPVSASVEVRFTVRPAGEGATITVPIVATAGRDRWPVPHDVELPRVPRVYVF